MVGLDGQHTLGDVNPHLTHAIAEGLTPYINNIAGLPGGPEGFAPLDDLGQWEDGSMPDAKGLVRRAEQRAVNGDAVELRGVQTGAAA